MFVPSNICEEYEYQKFLKEIKSQGIYYSKKSLLKIKQGFKNNDNKELISDILSYSEEKWKNRELFSGIWLSYFLKIKFFSGAEYILNYLKKNYIFGDKNEINEIINYQFGEEKESSLYLATKWSHLKIINLLFNLGADPNIKTAVASGFESPIHIAIKKNKLNVVKLLVENGADINSICDYFEKKTPLIIALKNKKMEIVKYILSLKNVNVNHYYRRYYYCNDIFTGHDSDDYEYRETYEEETALHMTVRNNNFQITELLLKYGANPKLEAKYYSENDYDYENVYNFNSEKSVLLKAKKNKNVSMMNLINNFWID